MMYIVVLWYMMTVSCVISTLWKKFCNPLEQKMINSAGVGRGHIVNILIIKHLDLNIS